MAIAYFENKYLLKTKWKNMSVKTWLILTIGVSEQKSVMRKQELLLLSNIIPTSSIIPQLP